MLKSVVEDKGENNSGKRESLSKLKRTQKKRKNIEVQQKWDFDFHVDRFV